MKVKGTTRDDFNTAIVQRLIEQDRLGKEDLTRILFEATVLVSTLREDYSKLKNSVIALAEGVR